MEAVGPIAGLATQTGSSVYPKMKRIVKFNKNLVDLENTMKRLKAHKDDVDGRLKLAYDDGRSSAAPIVNMWLEKVEEVEGKMNLIQQDIEKVNHSKLCRCLFRFFMRIRLSNKVERIAHKIEELLNEYGSLPDSVIPVNHQAKAVEHIPGPSIEEGTSAAENLTQLMKILDDDKFHRIGIWGMGGAGKTTLVRSLNNKLKTANSTQPFSTVIWVTVSQELDMKRVQGQIADRLNLVVNKEDSMEKTARRLYQRLEKEKRFLIILDDVWEEIDLDSLGVPQSRDHKGSNIILTSRSSDVCRQMVTDIEVRVNVLNEKEAWKLFSQYAGEVVSLREISPLAKQVARECCGLPLAVITVGCAMRRKNKVELWQYALTELQRSVPCIKGVKDKVYNSLKLSYDSLESNNNIKACFLYCALFPEDFSIEASELVGCWVAEGLIDEQDSFDDSVNRGIATAEILKDCCLLEEGARGGTVKMHDVVRDVAIWIASSLHDECKSLVRSGIGLNKISEAELSNSLKRISFMNNKITELPDCEIQSSKLSTLLLQGNSSLNKVPERFLQGFLALRVLNVSETRIQSLPHSLVQLSELRALLLGKCYSLEELPPLGTLSRLEILDLSSTGIRELPKDMKKLINLRQLNLSFTGSLTKIEAGIVSKWTCLEVLDMKCSAHHWGMKGEVENGQTSFEELGCLKQLVSLSIRFNSVPCLRPEDLTWLRKLRRFELVINSGGYFVLTRHDYKRMVDICGIPGFSRECGQLLNIDTSSLVINCCSGTVDMLEQTNSPSSRSCFADIHMISFDSFVGLKSLTITSSDIIFRPADQKVLSSVPGRDLLPHLEEINLHNLRSLGSISDLLGHVGVVFSRLKLIEVIRCNNMGFLLDLNHGTDFIMTLPNLEVVKVSSCETLMTLFKYVSVPKSRSDPIPPVAPKLRILEMKELYGLSGISEPSDISLSRLEYVEFLSCPNLTWLPISVDNAKSIKEIRGEVEWWSTLKLNDDHTKSFMQQYFKIVEPAARKIFTRAT